MVTATRRRTYKPIVTARSGDVYRFEAAPQSIQVDGLLFDMVRVNFIREPPQVLANAMYYKPPCIHALITRQGWCDAISKDYICAKRTNAGPHETGTIVDSKDAITKHWYRLGKQLGVDPESILATSHGRRSIDTLQLYDPKLANWEYVSEIEGRIPKDFGQDATEVPGSRALLESLSKVGAPWMIVTSATRALLTGWLNVMKMAEPMDMVVAEDVPRGKPDPTCYLVGRKRLGLSESAKCLVLEDSPSGIRAGKAAGFMVVAVVTTHEIKQLEEAGADWIVKDMTSVKLKSWHAKKGIATLVISDALVQ